MSRGDNETMYGIYCIANRSESIKAFKKEVKALLVERGDYKQLNQECGGMGGGCGEGWYIFFQYNFDKPKVRIGPRNIILAHQGETNLEMDSTKTSDRELVFEKDAVWQLVLDVCQEHYRKQAA